MMIGVESQALQAAIAKVGVQKVLEALGPLAEEIPYQWEFFARPSQLPPPGNWRSCLLLGGRGSGKTAAGAAWTRKYAEEHPGCHLALIAPTVADARDVMVRAVLTPWNGGKLREYPHYEPSKRVVTWKNGSRATTFSADEPERLRGGNYHAGWADEICFVAGTLVKTESGDRPIETIAPGERVWTRNGLRRVLRSGITRRSAAEVYEVLFSDGATLTGTANHPVFVAGRGFCPLISLRRGDMPLTWDMLYGVAKNGGSGKAITRIAMASYSIARNSLRRTGRYARRSTSITATAIRSTMTFPTWSPYQESNIVPSTVFPDGQPGPSIVVGKTPGHCGQKRSRQSEDASCVAERFCPPDSDLNFAIATARPLIGAKPIPAWRRDENISGVHRSLVPSAACHSKKAIPGPRHVRAPAASSTRPHVIGLRRLSEKATVYNLEVEGEPEYFANGILVHNCSWRYPDAWDQFQFGLRVGDETKAVVTTTPKPLTVSKLLARILKSPSTVVLRSTTFDNAQNLDPGAVAELRARYMGTRLGVQELEGRIIEAVEGALWTTDMIDKNRIEAMHTGDIVRTVIGVDPAVTSGENADMTGIVVCSKAADGHAYVLADYSVRASPDQWARRVVQAYRRHHATRVVCETNQGGDAWEHLLRGIDPHISFKGKNARHGKMMRAEPVAALYEQGKIHHVGNKLVELEEELLQFTPDGFTASPDRADALVHALTELMLSQTSALGKAVDYIRARRRI